MKKNIHPEYQEVLFVDSATGFKFVCGTAMKNNQTETFNGKELPVAHLSISASSHPLYVGGKQLIDVEGRVQKFENKYKAAQAKPKEEVSTPVAAPSSTKSKKK